MCPEAYGQLSTSINISNLGFDACQAARRGKRECHYTTSEGLWSPRTVYLMPRLMVTEPGCMLLVVEGNSELGVAEYLNISAF
jgi:hypothetical protein